MIFPYAHAIFISGGGKRTRIAWEGKNLAREKKKSMAPFPFHALLTFGFFLLLTFTKEIRIKTRERWIGRTVFGHSPDIAVEILNQSQERCGDNSFFNNIIGPTLSF